MVVLTMVYNEKGVHYYIIIVSIMFYISTRAYNEAYFHDGDDIVSFNVNALSEQ